MKKIQLAGMLLLALSLSNCKKDDATGPAGAQGPAGPSLTGNLKGYVSIYDQYGGKILTGQAGDTVSIDGTTKKAVTDTGGLYTFTGLSTGSYSLTITKPGFGTDKIQNIQFVGGSSDTYRDVKLSAPSTSNMASINDSIGPLTGNITVYGAIPTDVQARTFIAFVGDNAGVSSATSSYLVNYTKNVNAGAVKVLFVIPKSDLYDAGFAPGSTVYIAAYGVASLTASAYEDFSNGRTAYTSVSSTAATISIVVP